MIAAQAARVPRSVITLVVLHDDVGVLTEPSLEGTNAPLAGLGVAFQDVEIVFVELLFLVEQFG